jgi:predicted secreted Zn-dependent protease
MPRPQCDFRCAAVPGCRKFTAKQGTAMIRILLAAALVGLTAFPSAAESVSKTYSYFSVGGRTLDELESELNRRGPQVKSTGRRHPGATQMQFNTRLGYTEKNGSCRVTEANVTVKANVILPRWRQRARAEQDVRLIWDTLSSDIKRHEEQHVAIAQSHARELERKLMRLGRQKNCAIAGEKAKKTADKLLDKHDKAQAAFDRQESANFEKRLLKLLRERMKMIEAGQISG